MVLEQETDLIFRVLAGRTIGEQGSCRLEALTTADVPQGIKSFFRAEVRRRLEEDLAKSSWFTSIRNSGAGPARVAQALVMSLTDAYQFSRQDFLDTLDLAVRFVGNYLCRPQGILVDFLFDRTPRITVATLSDGLTWLADYRYLGDLAARALGRRGQEEVTREEFRTLVARIDEEVVHQHNARELAALTQPLFGFFRIADTEAGGSLPIDALEEFFDEKKLFLLKEYVRGICHLRNKTRITFDELAPLVEDVLAGKLATPPAPPAGSAPTPSDSTAPAPPANQETERLPQPGNAGPARIGQKGNIVLSLTFAGLKKNLVPPGPLPSVGSLISPEQRDRFITHVFDGDAAHYAGALVMLESFKTWEEAEAYLVELCRTNHLDLQAHDVAELVETVRRRYATTERAS
jgi:hypothetical protein